MKNIVNLLKYNLKSNVVSYTVEISILFIGMFMSLTGVSSLLISVPVVAVIVLVNFIEHIINFSKQLGDEDGKFIFMAPIKPIEFVISKYIEFILIQGVFVLLIVVASKLFLHDGGLESIAIQMLVGFFEMYIIVTSLIIISASYVRSTLISVIGVLFLMFIAIGITGVVEELTTRYLPYVYLRVDGLFEIALIPYIINLLIVIGIFIFGMKRFKKLDIA